MKKFVIHIYRYNIPNDIHIPLSDSEMGRLFIDDGDLLSSSSVLFFISFSITTA